MKELMPIAYLMIFVSYLILFIGYIKNNIEVLIMGLMFAVIPTMYFIYNLINILGGME